MKHLRNVFALGAAVALAAFCRSILAQDDLDDLLKDLEAEAVAPAGVSASEDAEEADEPAEVAEEPAEEAEEEPAEEAEEPADDADESGDEVEEESAEEPEEPAEEAEEASDEPEEEPAEEAEEPAEEPEEPAEEPEEAEEPAEEPEEVAAEEPAPVADAEEVIEEVGEAVAEGEEVSVEDDAAAVAEEPVAPAPVALAVNPAPQVGAYSGPDASLIASIKATEKIRREAYDLQARRVIDAARNFMRNGEYLDAARQYAQALKLLNDSPASAGVRRECEQGIAEGYYRAALQEDTTGRRDKAKEFMERAITWRHPKARRQLEAWNAEDDPDLNKTEVADITHRRNDQDYKDMRTANLEHLKRARQLLGARDLDRALDECELVLINDPYNRAAVRIRNVIEKKRKTIIAQERKAAREGMLADVDEAWRPVYAKDARQIESNSSTTRKDPLGEDPELVQEQTIIRRMKEMNLPNIDFKPPATIIDAIEYFRNASRDYDRPDLPLEQRGFNFVLKTPETLRATAQQEVEESEGFGSSDDEESVGPAQAGVPVIPMITAKEISFYEALKLVCESVDYKFKVQGPMVMIMPKDMTIEDMVTRSYPVVAAFMDRMGSASSDMKEMKSAGFGGSSSRRKEDEEENQEKDWKEFFELLGVKWPEGSSIMYIKTIGKLRVKNTYENLAELEKALTELNADPKLIEIEARFVEVCQEDLNSLGFEWILNSDYTLNVGKHLSRALHLKSGKWGSRNGSQSDSTTTTYTTDTYAQNGGMSSTITGTRYTSSSTETLTDTTYTGGAGNRWARDMTADIHGRSVGINAFGGDSAQGTGMRYLSTDSNPIAGESKSINDQFLRVNAFIGNADLSMILHMLAQRSDTDLLSAPKVLTKPGVQAIIKVVTEFIYPTDYTVQLNSSSSSSSSTSGSQSAILAVVEPESFTMREVGVILDVTPTLTDDGNLIDLELDTQVVDEPTWKNYGMRIPFSGNASNISFDGIGDILTGLSEVLATLGTGITDTVKATFAETAVNSASQALNSINSSSKNNIQYYEAPMEQPFFHVRHINSAVSVYPGATIVMGGLITEQRKAFDDKIPFLGDLPFIGRLFRSHSESTTKRNLLIFVTTRLVDVHGREMQMNGGGFSEGEVVAAGDDE